MKKQKNPGTAREIRRAYQQSRGKSWNKRSKG